MAGFVEIMEPAFDSPPLSFFPTYFDFEFVACLFVYALLLSRFSLSPLRIVILSLLLIFISSAGQRVFLEYTRKCSCWRPRSFHFSRFPTHNGSQCSNARAATRRAALARRPLYVLQEKFCRIHMPKVLEQVLFPGLLQERNTRRVLRVFLQTAARGPTPRAARFGRGAAKDARNALSL